MNDKSISNKLPPHASGVTSSNPTFDIQAFNSTVEILRRRLKIIEKTKQDLKNLKDMYDDFFLNQDGYQAVEKVVKEAVRKRKDIKAQLAKQPQIMEVFLKIKELKEQLKDNQQSLSYELMDYYKTSGVTEIEDEEGNVQEFEIVVKLKPKRQTGK